MPSISPINHIYLYCGFHFDHSKDYDVSSLKGEAKASAVKEKESEDDKIGKQKYKLNDFAEDVDRNMNTIVNSKDLKNAVISKLKERIETRKEKESHWSGVHKFFHRVGHVFRGHGFNTTAERAQIIETKLEGGLVSKKDAAAFFKTNIMFMELDKNAQIQDHIAGMSPEKIAVYVKEDVFSLNKTMTNMFSNWKQITDLWNPEQKKAFYNALLDRPDGLKLLSEGYINYGALQLNDKTRIKEMDSFIDRTKFINKCIESYKSLQSYGPSFPQWVTEVILLEGMNQNKWGKIEPLLSSLNLSLLASMLLKTEKPNEDLFLINEEELKKLNDNLNVSKF